MPTCDGCGAWVSREYHRVFAVDGELQGCQACGPIHGGGERVRPD